MYPLKDDVGRGKRERISEEAWGKFHPSCYLSLCALSLSFYLFFCVCGDGGILKYREKTGVGLRESRISR
jgi:hypothetical protein